MSQQRFVFKDQPENEEKNRKINWDLISIGFLVSGLIMSIVLLQVQRTIEMELGYIRYIIAFVVLAFYKIWERILIIPSEFTFSRLESTFWFDIADIVFALIGVYIGDYLLTHYGISELLFITVIGFIIYYVFYLFRIWRQKESNLIIPDQPIALWQQRMAIILGLFIGIGVIYLWHTRLVNFLPEYHIIYITVLVLLAFDFIGRLMIRSKHDQK